MQNDIVKLARPEIVAMQAYSSARNENQTGNIWLDANESPWNDTGYNRYPEPQPQGLIEKLATLYGVPNNTILISRGSDEGIDLLLRLFCRASIDSILICPPTYGMYKVAAVIQQASVIEAALNKTDGFTLDINEIKKQWQSNIKLVFLCSPNNPTGNLLARETILSLCQQLAGLAIVVVDEAYIEFSNVKSLAENIQHYPNLIILRTLSKAYGLAGIRCGVTIANAEIISLLKKIIAPYPIPTPIIDVVFQHLDITKIQNKIAITNQEKSKLIDFLQKLPFVKEIFPSSTNFLLVEVIDAEHVMASCLRQGIVIRNRSRDFNLDNCLRFSIGTPAENQKLMETLLNV